MNTKKLRRLAISASTIGALCIGVAACTGDDDDDDDVVGGDVVLKANGMPADFACNGSFTDPVSLNSNINANFLVVSQEASGTPVSANTRVAVFNAATGTTTGAFAITSGNGMAQIAGVLKDSTRYNYKLTRPAGASTYVDTYTFGSLTPTFAASTTSSGRVNLRIISSTVYSVFIGLLGAQPADVAGTTQIAGTVLDCDGDLIQNATVEVAGPGGTGIAKRCGEDNHGYPCVAYFASGTPNRNATDSDASGQFVVLGAPVGSTFAVKVLGITTDGQAAAQIGETTINGKADSVSLASTRPLP